MACCNNCTVIRIKECPHTTASTSVNGTQEFVMPIPLVDTGGYMPLHAELTNPSPCRDMDVNIIIQGYATAYVYHEDNPCFISYTMGADVFIDGVDQNLFNEIDTVCGLQFDPTYNTPLFLPWVFNMSQGTIFRSMTLAPGATVTVDMSGNTRVFNAAVSPNSYLVWELGSINIHGVTI